MHTVTLESITPLLHPDNGAAASIYFPTHRQPAPENTQEDKIRFKNLIREAKESLERRGIDKDNIRKIGNKLEEVYDNQKFWLTTTEGTAIFVTKSSVQAYHLPLECDEYVYTGEAFDIAPLIVFCSYDRPFHFLALALHDPVVYKGDMYGIERLDIDLPGSPEEALNLDEPFANSQTRRSRVVLGGGGRMDGNYARSSGGHGEGDTREVGNDERDAYYKIIDNKLMESEKFDSRLPLLIAAATESDIASYRAGSKHQHILSAHLDGNHTASRLKDLHRDVWPIIRKEIGENEEKDAVDRYQEMAGTGKASSDMTDIAQAASEGKIDTLIAAVMVHTRDSVRDSVDLIEKFVFPDVYRTGGLREVMIQTHEHGGRVIGCASEEGANNDPARAIYRY